MTTDHKAEALLILEKVSLLDVETSKQIYLAHVHATLAVADQQKRTADWLERWPIAHDYSPVISVNQS